MVHRDVWYGIYVSSDGIHGLMWVRMEYTHFATVLSLSSIIHITQDGHRSKSCQLSGQRLLSKIFDFLKGCSVVTSSKMVSGSLQWPLGLSFAEVESTLWLPDRLEFPKVLQYRLPFKKQEKTLGFNLNANPLKQENQSLSFAKVFKFLQHHRSCNVVS